MNDDILKNNQEKMEQAKDLFRRNQDQNQDLKKGGYKDMPTSKLKKLLIIYNILGYFNASLFIIFFGLMIWMIIELGDCKGSGCAGGILPAFTLWPVVIFFALTVIFFRKTNEIKKFLKSNP